MKHAHASHSRPRRWGHVFIRLEFGCGSALESLNFCLTKSARGLVVAEIRFAVTPIGPVHDGFAPRSQCGSWYHWCASAVVWQLIFRDGRYGTAVCPAHQQSGMEVCPNPLRDLTRRVNACDRPERSRKIKEEFGGRLFDKRKLTDIRGCHQHCGERAPSLPTKRFHHLLC